jgi:hypothetical protein
MRTYFKHAFIYKCSCTRLGRLVRCLSSARSNSKSN